MHLDLTVVILFSYLLDNCVCKWATGQVYWTHGEYSTAGNPLHYKIPAKSTNMCAMLCFNDDRCATFDYNVKSEICYCSEGLVPRTKKNAPFVATGSCPRELGYSLYLREKNLLCLKYYGYTATPNQANQTCVDDGGHLILIENESMVDFVIDIMNTWSWAQILIDGSDKDNDRVYMTSRGDPLPYVPLGSWLKDPNDFVFVWYMRRSFTIYRVIQEEDPLFVKLMFKADKQTSNMLVHTSDKKTWTLDIPE